MSTALNDLVSSTNSAWKIHSTALILKLKLHITPSHISIPLARYIQASYMALPVKTVVLVERPYGTDILPEVASAMSYNVEKNGKPTPSTAILATVMKNLFNEKWETTEAWFRDSWMYIRSGVFLINVCCFEPFMKDSLEERTAVCSFVRDMIEFSHVVSGTTVDLIALGNPATACADKIRSSMADRSKKVKVLRGPNPAGLKHKFGDLTSPLVTLGKGTQNVAKALHSAIVRSRDHPVTTLQQYIMSSDSSSIANAGKTLISDLERVELFFKNGGKYQGPTSDQEVFSSLRKSVSSFINTITSARVTAAIQDWAETGGIAKGAYKSGNRGYQPKNYNKGTSSEKSTTPSNKPFLATPSKAKFAEDDEEEQQPEIPAPDASTENTDRVLTPSSTPALSIIETPSKAPKLNTPSSIRSGRSVSTGTKTTFLEDIEEDYSGAVTVPVSPPASITKEERNVVEMVNEIVNSNKDFNIKHTIVEEVGEFTRSLQPSTDTAKALLATVREVLNNEKYEVDRDLGYVDGNLSMQNPIVQLFLKWSV